MVNTLQKHSRDIRELQMNVDGAAKLGKVSATRAKRGQLFDNQAGQENSELLSAEELSQRLHVPKKTIQQWRYKGVLPANAMLKVGPRHVRYRWRVIERWLNHGDDPE